ncbi:MAG: DUF6249 domain-containing protein [Bacteroidota bacterium]
MDDMFEFLLPIGVLGTIGLTIGYLIKTMTDYRLKKKLIEKGLISQEAGSLFQSHKSENKYASLKWGLIILCGGIGLIIINYIEYYRDSPLPFGVLAVSIASGFLIYYFMVKRSMEE